MLSPLFPDVNLKSAPSGIAIDNAPSSETTVFSPRMLPHITHAANTSTRTAAPTMILFMMIVCK